VTTTSIASVPRDIVLIHGLWMTALSWENWVERYRARGHNVIARSWPGADRDIDEVRRDPSPMDHLGVGELVDHYAQIVRALPRPPIIMGHSFGALITQVLLDHGLGSAGVSIDAAPVKGVYKLPWSTLRSSFPVLKNPMNNHRTVALTPEEFRYAFGNTLTEEQSLAAWRRYAIPGPGRVLFQAAFASFSPNATTKIDFGNNERAPLLIISGGQDHVSPPSVNRKMAELQHRSKAITAFQEFAGRSHFILGQPGWEEVADFALDWATQPRELG
jgi:pimeloyl-ACP methyl ester carboxylesterase